MNTLGMISQAPRVSSVRALAIVEYTSVDGSMTDRIKGAVPAEGISVTRALPGVPPLQVSHGCHRLSPAVEPGFD
jgi:hypothetical protein